MLETIRSNIRNLHIPVILLLFSLLILPEKIQARPREIVELNTGRIEEIIFKLTNDERKRQRLQPYRPMQELKNMARMHSSNMVTRRFFSHTDRNRMGPKERFKSRYPGWIIGLGENIGYFDGNTEEEVARKLMKGWMRSKGHRANILHKDFRFMGVGVARLKNRYYATQNFADPIAKMTENLPENIRTGESRKFTFKYMGNFPRNNLSIFVEFPDKNAKFTVDKVNFYRGVGRFNPVWNGHDLFSFNLDFKYGKGDYILKMGKDGLVIENGIEITTR